MQILFELGCPIPDFLTFTYKLITNLIHTSMEINIFTFLIFNIFIFLIRNIVIFNGGGV